MPAVFSQVLYGNKAPAATAPAVSNKAVVKTQHTGSSSKSKKPTVDASTMFSTVLRKVADYTPAATLKKPKSAPKKPKDNNKSTKQKKTKKKIQKKKDKEKIKVTKVKSGQEKRRNNPKKWNLGDPKVLLSPRLQRQSTSLAR